MPARLNAKIDFAGVRYASVNYGFYWGTSKDQEGTYIQGEGDWKWTSDYNGTGVGGDIITASNGNSIFLPAAGYRYNADLEYAGSIGYYWSSSLLTASPIGAWYVFFDSDTVIRLYYDRCNGYSIRPVYEE